MSVNIKYKNNSIAELTDTGTKTLKTAGKYCEADIIVENTKDGGGATEPYIEEVYDSSGNLINATLHGYTVIRDNAFLNCSSLALTSLPSGITNIGNYAFQGCSSLASLTFEGKPTSISKSAFRGCTNLTTINVPWAEGEVANAPWGATNATINYNYTGA